MNKKTPEIAERNQAMIEKKTPPPKPPGKQIAVVAVMPVSWDKKTGAASKKNRTSFKKGARGNPSGRPKRTPEELDLIAACKAKSPAALEVIDKLMYGASSDAVKFSAAVSIIERGYGRATTFIDAKITAFHETSIDELK